MKKINQIKIFISCPSDIKDELDSIKLIINEINKTSGSQNNFMLEIINWKYDTYTDIASDGQEVINQQTREKYDILVGIMWLRAGTPTKRDKSGTIEEINDSLIDISKERLIYFRTSSIENPYDIDFEQFKIIKEFKKELSEKGVLYKEYNTTEIFENLFRINLSNLIIEKIINKKTIKDKDIKDTQIAIIEDKYSSIRNLISDVESKNDSAYNIDIFEIIEESKSYIENVTFSLNSMTNSMGYFSERMNYRAEELNKVNQIKDTRLKTNKVLKTVNYLAEELEEFNLRINKEIPFFSENFKAAGKSYSKLLLAYKGNNSEEVTELKSNIKLFVDNVEIALNSSVILLQTVINLPLINTKFNQSKRETELSIKNITKEMLDGLLIFENAINE